MKIGRRCVWCGGPANSKEHVYPQWLRAFQGPSAFIEKHGRSQLAEPLLVSRVSEEGELVEYEHTRSKRVPVLHDVQVKVVCAECNSGWMSRMETTVKPLIKRLVLPASLRSPAVLATDEKRELATWVHKCFLMYAQWYEPDDRPFRSEDYTAFYEKRRPHGNVRIYMGVSKSPYAEFGMWIDSRLFIPGKLDPATYAKNVGHNCCSAFLAVDGLVFVEHWFSPEYPQANLLARHVKSWSDRQARRAGVTPIWPAHASRDSWPTKVLTHAESEAARLSLFRCLERLPVAAKRLA